MNVFHNVANQINETVAGSRMAYYQTTREFRDKCSLTLMGTLGVRDPYLLTHSRRVTHYAMRLAQRLRLSEPQFELIRLGGIFHDIGKLGIPQELLSKPAPLTASEYTTVKTHPELGAALLYACSECHAVIPIVRHHHEFFDGHGYPDEIAGEQIEIEARIIAVADAIDVMKSDHPYRRALSVRQVIAELCKCANTQFDPLVVEAATELLQEM